MPPLELSPEQRRAKRQRERAENVRVWHRLQRLAGVRPGLRELGDEGAWAPAYCGRGMGDRGADGSCMRDPGHGGGCSLMTERQLGER
jgi:hypothetical protein